MAAKRYMLHLLLALPYWVVKGMPHSGVEDCMGNQSSLYICKVNSLNTLLINSIHWRLNTVEESRRLLSFVWGCLSGHWALLTWVCMLEHVSVCAGAFFLCFIRKLITIELCYCAGRAYFYWTDFGP